MNELNLNIFNLIIIFGVAQGFIFSFIVLTQKKYITNNTIYLGLTVLFLSLSNLQYWWMDTQLVNQFPILKLMYIPWHWLILPMFYLFVHKFVGKNKLKNNIKLLLIIPFFIILLIHLLYVLLFQHFNGIHKMASHFQRGIYVYLEFLSFIFNVIIMILVYNMIIRHENDTSYNINWIKSETDWLKKLIYVGFLICLCWLIALIIVVIYNMNTSYIFYPMWIGISFLIYWIGYMGLSKSQQLKKRIELRKKRILGFQNGLAKNSTQKKPNNYDKISNFIKTKKLYLDPNLSLQMLSQELNFSEGYISQIINKNSNYNFNDYINFLRVNETKNMLTNIEYDNYTINAIGLEAGFNSKSSFYTAFKKFTGQTPNEYKKEVRNL